MAAVLWTTELMTASQVQGAATRVGCRLQTVANENQLVSQAAACQARLVIVDLSTPGCQPAQFMPALRELAPPPRVIAFGPHVHEARLAAAVDAGADLVLSRGQFRTQVDELLRAAAD